MTRVSIVGASGYVGGELLRLLLRTPMSASTKSPQNAWQVSPSVVPTPICAG